MAFTNTYCDYANGNDYSGAGFVNGTWANATLTLSQAGNPFGACLVGHWLYVTDNGSGQVTAGYYRITGIGGIPGAVVLHADIRSGVPDPVDVVCVQATGAIGLPWRTVQGALDLITRDAVNGDQVNVQDGTAQVTVASLTCATYGVPTSSVNLAVRGYNAAANDGGVAEIDCGGNVMWTAVYNGIILIDLECRTFGNNAGISLSQGAVIRCEIHRGASAPVGQYLLVTSNSYIADSYFHDAGNTGRAMSCASDFVINNFSETAGRGITINAGVVIGNICLLTTVAAVGIYGYGQYVHYMHNAVYNTAAGTDRGIRSSAVTGTIHNNVVVGWSGVGGRGIELTATARQLGPNAFWNCTVDNSVGAEEIGFDLRASDIALGADPFTNAAGGDFSLTAAGLAALRSLGWPADIGASGTDPHLTLGPAQYGDTPPVGGFPQQPIWHGV